MPAVLLVLLPVLAAGLHVRQESASLNVEDISLREWMKKDQCLNLAIQPSSDSQYAAMSVYDFLTKQGLLQHVTGISSRSSSGSLPASFIATGQSVTEFEKAFPEDGPVSTSDPAWEHNYQKFLSTMPKNFEDLKVPLALSVTQWDSKQALDKMYDSEASTALYKPQTHALVLDSGDLHHSMLVASSLSQQYVKAGCQAGTIAGQNCESVAQVNWYTGGWFAHSKLAKKFDLDSNKPDDWSPDTSAMESYLGEAMKEEAEKWNEKFLDEAATAIQKAFGKGSGSGSSSFIQKGGMGVSFAEKSGKVTSGDPITDISGTKGLAKLPKCNRLLHIQFVDAAHQFQKPADIPGNPSEVVTLVVTTPPAITGALGEKQLAKHARSMLLRKPSEILSSEVDKPMRDGMVVVDVAKDLSNTQSDSEQTFNLDAQKKNTAFIQQWSNQEGFGLDQ